MAVCPSNDRPASAQAARRDRLIASCNAMVVSVQTPAEVPGGGRVRQAVHADGVQEHGVVALSLDVVKTNPRRTR